jgi:hypothetical protein
MTTQVWPASRSLAARRAATTAVPELPPGWQCRDQRRYGGSTVVLLEMVLLETVAQP